VDFCLDDQPGYTASHGSHGLFGRAHEKSFLVLVGRDLGSWYCDDGDLSYSFAQANKWLIIHFGQASSPCYLVTDALPRMPVSRHCA
jgi:hypothetical protein